MVTGQWGHPGHVVSGASPSACAFFLGGFLLVASAREHEEPPRRLSFLLFFSISTAQHSRAEHDRLRSHLALPVSSAFHTVLVPASINSTWIWIRPILIHHTNLDGRFH